MRTEAHSTHTEAEERSELSPGKALAIVANETRLAILHALWEAREQHPEDGPLEPAVPFSVLQERVGMRDSGQFNYHLRKLDGSFIHRTADGYVLRSAGEEIVSAVLAGAVTDRIVFDAEPIDDPCPLCGGPVVLDYDPERTLDCLVARCTACEGAMRTPAGPGTLMFVKLLRPAGVYDRTPAEMYRAQYIWTKHQILSMVEGVCPDCSGTVAVTPMICEEHAREDGHVCEQCGTIFEIVFVHICNVCNGVWIIVSDRHILAHPTVAVFYHDHGYDDPWGHDWLRVGTETIAEQTVVRDDPLEIAIAVAIDGDRLDVTLDSEGTVIDVRT